LENRKTKLQSFLPIISGYASTRRIFVHPFLLGGFFQSQEKPYQRLDCGLEL
jgi:hypothetical protein